MTPNNTQTTHFVGHGGVRVDGRLFNSPELEELMGKCVTIDLMEEDSLTAIATFEGRSFQIHACEPTPLPEGNVGHQLDILGSIITACIEAGDDSGSAIFNRLIQEHPLTDDEYLRLAYLASGDVS